MDSFSIGVFLYGAVITLIKYMQSVTVTCNCKLYAVNYCNTVQTYSTHNASGGASQWCIIIGTFVAYTTWWTDPSNNFHWHLGSWRTRRHLKAS